MDPDPYVFGLPDPGSRFFIWIRIQIIYQQAKKVKKTLV